MSLDETIAGAVVQAVLKEIKPMLERSENRIYVRRRCLRCWGFHRKRCVACVRMGWWLIGRMVRSITISRRISKLI